MIFLKNRPEKATNPLHFMSGMGLSIMAPSVGLEPTTARLTVSVNKIPLFPPVPNSPILPGFLEPVETMEIATFHYFRTFQKNVEQNWEQKAPQNFAPQTHDIFYFDQ